MAGPTTLRGNFPSQRPDRALSDLGGGGGGPLVGELAEGVDAELLTELGGSTNLVMVRRGFGELEHALTVRTQTRVAANAAARRAGMIRR
jgi:hypothetical protein